MKELMEGFRDAMGFIDRLSFSSFFQDLGCGFGATVILAALGVFLLSLIFLVFGFRRS